MANRVVVYCSNVYSSLGLIRCLGEAGFSPECYCYGKNCEYLLASKYVSKGQIFKTAEDVLEFLIEEYPCYEEKPVLYTLPDPPAYFVDQFQDRLKEKFILMTAGAQGRITYWMDKRNQASLAKRHGLIVPWTMELSKNEAIPESIKYPVFTKSTKTIDGGKCDEGICWTKEDLEARQSMVTSDQFLVMDYIQKQKEIDFFGLSLHGKVYIDYHDEIDRFPDSAFGYYGIFKKCKHDEIYQKCVAMMEEIGYDGLFDIEFLLGKDGILYFMEINFRVDGAIYKLMPGINYPAEWYQLIHMNKDSLPAALSTKKESFTGITEVNDFRTSVLSGKMNPFKWFWQFCTADTRMLFNLKDPKPAYIRLYCYLRRDILCKQSS